MEKSRSSPPRAPGLRTSLIVVLPLLTAFLFLAGCASHEHRRAEHRARMVPPQKPLDGRTTFFGGTLLVEATLRAPFTGRPHSEGSQGGAGGSGGAQFSGGGHFGGGGGFHGGGHHHSEGAEGGEGSSGGGMRAAYLGMPRQTLHLTFTNTGGQTMEFYLDDISSVLGDFAANPDHLALASGQHATIDPMVGTYPANLDELDVTVTLHQGEHAETQVIKLTAPPPPPPSAAAAAQPPPPPSPAAATPMGN